MGKPLSWTSTSSSSISCSTKTLLSSFSLAYGTLTLLRDTKMHLKRDRFYGLLGPNQCGKTTLMRAIAREQLEGFPKRDELKSVFVEHEIEDEEVGVQEDGFP